MRRFAVPLLLLGLLAAATPPNAARPDESGSWLERRLESLLPGLRIRGLESAWRGRPTAERITLSDARGVWLTLERVTLNLAPTALLRGEVRLEELEAALVRLDRLPEPAQGAATPEPPPPAQRGVLQLPDLPVDVSIDRFGVERLELAASVAGQSAAFSAEGMAALRSAGVRARLGLLRLDGAGEARVDIALAPKSNRLSADITAREPPHGIVPGLLGRPDHPFSLALRLTGPASGATLSLDAALGPDVSLAAAGEVRATPEGAYGATVRGEARAAPLLPPDIAPLVAAAKYSLDADLPPDGPLALRSLRVSVPAGAASAGGTLDLRTEAADLRLHLDLAEAERFAPLLPRGVAWSEISAEARITGTLSQPALRLEATARELATGVASADAVLGSAPRLAVRAALPGPALDATLDGAEGKLAMQGTLGEPIDVTARLLLPRLAALDPASEGSLKAVVRVEGSRTDPTVTAAAHSGRIAAAGRVLEAFSLHARVETLFSSPRVRAEAAGRLEDMPLSLAVLGRPEGDRLRLEEGEARLGPARLTLTGVLDPAAPVFDGALRAEAADLAPLARLGGIADLAGRLTLQARLAPAPGGAQGFDATLDAPRIVYAGTAGDLHATAEGTPAGFDWSVRGRAAEGAASGRGRVAATEAGGWRLHLAALEARAADETLRLADPAQVTLAPDGGVAVPGLALALSGGGRVRAEGRWGPERADLRIALAEVPLSIAASIAPAVRPQGTLSGEVRAAGPVA